MIEDKWAMHILFVGDPDVGSSTFVHRCLVDAPNYHEAVRETIVNADREGTYTLYDLGDGERLGKVKFDGSFIGDIDTAERLEAAKMSLHSALERLEDNTNAVESRQEAHATAMGALNLLTLVRGVVSW